MRVSRRISLLFLIVSIERVVEGASFRANLHSDLEESLRRLGDAQAVEGGDGAWGRHHGGVTVGAGTGNPVSTVVGNMIRPCQTGRETVEGKLTKSEDCIDEVSVAPLWVW